jgi:hypothetical protein
VALALLVLFVIGIKVFEDVITEDSGPINTAVLWFVRQQTRRALTDFFGSRHRSVGGDVSSVQSPT